MSSRTNFVFQTYEDRLVSKDVVDSKPKPLQSPNVPPPPPPLPVLDGDSPAPVPVPKPVKTKGKAPPVPVKYSTLSYNQPQVTTDKKTFSISAYNNQDYYCPTPDYDTLSIASSTSTFRPTVLNDSVEMESLESFRLDGSSEVPKPPNTYFKRGLAPQKSADSSASGTLKRRPVSVTIGEYPTVRRQSPGKLDFLEERKSGKEACFVSELAQTLNRSNLRKRTESVECLLSAKEDITAQTNGAVRISLNGRNFAKSTENLLHEGIYGLKQPAGNKVTININNLNNKGDNPLGILKNGGKPVHKLLSQQKSITFGEMPTVMNKPQVT